MQAQEVKKLILSDEFVFWQNCTNYCTVLKALVAALKEFNGKQPCMEKVYIVMTALRDHVVALYNASSNMPSHLVDPFEVALRKREALVHNDLHHASALFNPYLIHKMELCDDQHAMVGLMRVFKNSLTSIRSSKLSKLNSINTFTSFTILWRLRMESYRVKEVAYV